MLKYGDIQYIVEHDAMKTYFQFSIDSPRLLPYKCEHIEQRKIEQQKQCELQIKLAA
jgi:hypothetical protein